MTAADDPEPSVTISDADRRIVLPIEEVAELTGIPVRRLKRNTTVNGGKVPVERLGNEWLIPRAWVEWIASWPRSCDGEAAS